MNTFSECTSIPGYQNGRGFVATQSSRRVRKGVVCAGAAGTRLAPERALMEAMHDERRHAQPQHVLEEQQHIAGQGGYAAPGDLPHGGAPQAKLYDNNLLPADMRDERQRARDWAETHGHHHKQVYAQPQHVLEEQQHIAGQGGHAALGDHPHGGAPQAKLYDKSLLAGDPHGAAPLCMDDLVTNSPRRQLERLLAAAPTAGSRPVSARAVSAADRVGVQARAVAHPVPWCTCTARTRR